MKSVDVSSTSTSPMYTKRKKNANTSTNTSTSKNTRTNTSTRKKKITNTSTNTNTNTSHPRAQTRVRTRTPAWAQKHLRSYASVSQEQSLVMEIALEYRLSFFLKKCPSGFWFTSLPVGRLVITFLLFIYTWHMNAQVYNLLTVANRNGESEKASGISTNEMQKDYT